MGNKYLLRLTGIIVQVPTLVLTVYLGTGGKNTIFLLDLTGPEYCQYYGQLCGHNDRVTSIQFCKTSTYSRCCVSGSEDHCVIKWDIDAKEAISKQSRHQV